MVAVLYVGAAAGPESAQAFVGESLVVNPAGTDLTAPAKSILTNPTFLTDNVGEAAAFGGVQEASGALSVFEAAGILPTLGSALGAFGLGAGIGSFICNEVIGLEGCWFYGSESADPSKPSGYWSLQKSKQVSPEGGVIWPYQLAYSVTSTGPPVGLFRVGSKCNEGGSPVPGESGRVPNEVAECFISPSKYPSPSDWAYRTQMENRQFTPASKAEASSGTQYSGSGYCPINGSVVGSCVGSTPSDWSQRLASVIGNSAVAPVGVRERVGQSIARALSPSTVADPYADVTIPDCGAYVWGECAERLEELGLKPERSELGWEKAVVAKPADFVVETKPGAGGAVVKGSTVTVVTNPGEADMPIVVPQPEAGETYGHYVARLNPALAPERHDLEAAYVSPAAGPDGVVSVSPEPSTRLNPHTEHSVRVTTNPGDAPEPSAAWSPPALPSIDLGPISGIPSPCGVFPFGLFCWVGEAFAQFNTSGTCPHFSAPVADTGSDFDVTLCGETAETIMGYLRPALLLAFVVGCGFLFARGTRAVGSD